MRIAIIALAVISGVAAADAPQPVFDRSRVELVPVQPRPLTEPLKGVKPKVTVGTSEKYLPDDKKAAYDPVSAESREHLETLIQELRKR